MDKRYLAQLKFFGITPENAPQIRRNLFTQIHEIVFHGKGGYDWDTIYNMPRWLRQFTFDEINKFYSKKAEAEEAAANKGQGNTKTLMDPSGKIDRSHISKQFQQNRPAPKYK